jgi:hypothetical protein
MKLRRQELEASGMPKKEAWAVAASEFTPDFVADTQESAGTDRQSLVERYSVDRCPAGQEFRPMSDAAWAYHNGVVRHPDLDSAPSTGAILLLLVAKRDPSQFVTQIWSLFAKQYAASELAKEMHDDGREQIELLESLDKMLGSHHEASSLNTLRSPVRSDHNSHTCNDQAARQ